jgi:hypothetical protein
MLAWPARIAGNLTRDDGRDPLAISRSCCTRCPLSAVQTAACLVLVRSNTAFTDEADYLQLGLPLIAHWLHGKSGPAGYADRVLSGAPSIYPPLGALADSVGGVVGARTLSLAFMVAATVLVYRTASRLLGRTEATIAAALWALSEPVLRLAFATYDPMSVFLVALAASLGVEAGYGRRRRVVVLCSGVALGLGVAVAYSAIAIAPVVIAFGFVTWWHRFDTRQAALWAVAMTATAAGVFTLAITACASWPGIAFSIFNRKVNDHQSSSVILGHVATSSGLIIVLALIGAAAAIREPNRPFRFLVILLGATALVVPRPSSTCGRHGRRQAAFTGPGSRRRRAAALRGGTLVAAAGIRSSGVVQPAALGWSSYRRPTGSSSQPPSGWPNATSFVSFSSGSRRRTPG